MKFPCFAYLLFLPVFLFFSCSGEDPEKTKYDDGKPVTVIINNLSAPFVPGTELLVRLNFEARGNGTVDSAGTARISLHYPTGLAFHGYDSTDNRLNILKDYKTRETLFQSKTPFIMDYDTTVVSFDFLADFQSPPP